MTPSPRSLQEDLLADLQETAPMPDPRPGPQRRAKRPPVEAGTAPSVELRVTRTRWVSPSMRLASKGVVLTAGPITVSVGLSGRS
jgi:hypothetical protein